MRAYLRDHPGEPPRAGIVPASSDERQYLTTGEIAEIVGCATKTAAKWIDSGLLAGERLPSGDRRVTRGDLASFLHAHGIARHVALEAPLVLRVLGDPRAQARQRFDPRHNRTYTADPTARWKAIVHAQALQQRPDAPLEGPLRADVDVLLPCSDRRVRPARQWATRRVDRDNLDKPVLDAMTRAGWWHDDAQVRDGRIRVMSHAAGEEPGVIVRVWRLTAPPC